MVSGSEWIKGSSGLELSLSYISRPAPQVSMAASKLAMAMCIISPDLICDVPRIGHLHKLFYTLE
jgi:hypothetical protein